MTMGARRRRSCFAVHCTVVASVVSDGRTKQTQTQVNPSYQKYSTLPKFGNVACVGHPSPQKGRSYVVTNAGWELRWTRAALKAGLLRAGRDEPREHGTNRIDGRRSNLVKLLAKQETRIRRNRVVLAVVATVKPLRRRQRVNRRGAVHFVEVTEARRNSSPGRARHRPSNHRAGKAWSRLPCVSPVHCVCNQFAYGFLWVLAGARSSLRPFVSRGEARSIARANLPRDCERVSATRM